MLVVRRAFKNYGQTMLPGSVVEPGNIKRVKTRIKDRYLVEVDEHNIDKWKEYREERALCDSSINKKESYLPLHYYRNMERTTKSLIKELKEDYKYELKR